MCLIEKFESFCEPRDSLQRKIFEAHRSVKVFDGEDFTELTLKDAMRQVPPPPARQADNERFYERPDSFFRNLVAHELLFRPNAVVCQEYFEKDIRKPGVLHRDPRGDVRFEAIQPANAKSVPLKSMSNAELTKLGLPVQRKKRG
jgi:hypothetical protein